MEKPRVSFAGRTSKRVAIALGIVLLFCCARERPGQYPVSSDDATELPPPVDPPQDLAAPSPVYREAGRATFYASRFTGRKTSNGERYDPRALTAAHRKLPLGTLVEV